MRNSVFPYMRKSRPCSRSLLEFLFLRDLFFRSKYISYGCRQSVACIKSIFPCESRNIFSRQEPISWRICTLKAKQQIKMSYIMLPSALHHLQEHIYFFLAKEKRITTKKTDLSCDTVPLKDRIRLPSFSSFFVQMILNRNVS